MQSASRTRSICIIAELIFLSANVEAEDLRTLYLKQRLYNRGYPVRLVKNILSEVRFENRKEALRSKPKQRNEILLFVTTYNPAVLNLKKILMKHWHIIQNQPPGLAQIFKHKPIVSYRKEKSLKDILVCAKIPQTTIIIMIILEA